MLPLFYSSAFAYGDHGRDRHYYREGRWYRHDSSGIEIAVAALALGAYVASLPPRYTTVQVQGSPYYYDGTTYYAQAQGNGGYVVVQPPVEALPQGQIQESLTVNIPNSRNGFTSVTLRRSGNGFIGPQGEYYSEHPTIDQLKTLYGK